MSKTMNKSGSCLCGKVRFSCAGVLENVSACHCEGCRKWGGGPYFAVKCGNNVVFDGEENISIYDSSNWAHRGFCNVCGSSLFYKFKETGEYRMSLGIFDDEDGLYLEQQYFVDAKSKVYNLENRTEDFTTAEVFAMFKK